jgi:hypothetical protein
MKIAVVPKPGPTSSCKSAKSPHLVNEAYKRMTTGKAQFRVVLTIEQAGPSPGSTGGSATTYTMILH